MAKDVGRNRESEQWEKEFGFPNELRLYGPEECVGIPIKHQSYDGNDWNCFLDHHFAEKALATSAGPVSTQIRLNPSPRTHTLFVFHDRFLDCLPRTNYIPMLCCFVHWFSQRVLCRFIVRLSIFSLHLSFTF